MMRKIERDRKAPDMLFGLEAISKMQITFKDKARDAVGVNV
jgi:hypothetical protein